MTEVGDHWTWLVFPLHLIYCWLLLYHKHRHRTETPHSTQRSSLKRNAPVHIIYLLKSCRIYYAVLQNRRMRVSFMRGSQYGQVCFHLSKNPALIPPSWPTNYPSKLLERVACSPIASYTMSQTIYQQLTNWDSSGSILRRHLIYTTSLMCLRPLTAAL